MNKNRSVHILHLKKDLQHSPQSSSSIVTATVVFVCPSFPTASNERPLCLGISRNLRPVNWDPPFVERSPPFLDVCSWRTPPPHKKKGEIELKSEKTIIMLCPCISSKCFPKLDFVDPTFWSVDGLWNHCSNWNLQSIWNFMKFYVFFNEIIWNYEG